MNVPTYLLALHVLGPRFTTPILRLVESLFIRFGKLGILPVSLDKMKFLCIKNVIVIFIGCKKMRALIIKTY